MQVCQERGAMTRKLRDKLRGKPRAIFSTAALFSRFLPTEVSQRGNAPGKMATAVAPQWPGLRLGWPEGCHGMNETIQPREPVELRTPAHALSFYPPNRSFLSPQVQPPPPGG